VIGLVICSIVGIVFGTYRPQGGELDPIESLSTIENYEFKQGSASFIIMQSLLLAVFLVSRTDVDHLHDAETSPAPPFVANNRRPMNSTNRATTPEFRRDGM